MLIKKFVIYYKTLGKADRTCREYEKEIKYFAKFLDSRYQNSGLTLEELLICVDKSDAYAYTAHCLVELKNSSATRARKISALRMFYKFLIQGDYISSNPFESIDRPKIPRTLWVEDANKRLVD